MKKKLILMAALITVTVFNSPSFQKGIDLPKETGKDGNTILSSADISEYSIGNTNIIYLLHFIGR
jgi:hypothetical protein